jgi:hypothetical protein
LTTSDDAHSIAQVGTCYGALRKFLRAAGVPCLWRMAGPREGRMTWTRVDDWDNDLAWATVEQAHPAPP